MAQAEPDFVWNCDYCGKGVVRDSNDHDNSICNVDGSKWWCSACFHDGRHEVLGCPCDNCKDSDSSDEEEDDEIGECVICEDKVNTLVADYNDDNGFHCCEKDSCLKEFWKGID